MADATRLLSDMNYIINLQKYLPGVLIGFYLTEEDAASIGDTLASNHPIENSIGRYRGVPVYTHAHLSEAMESDHGQHGNVVYAYVPMLAVD